MAFPDIFEYALQTNSAARKAQPIPMRRDYVQLFGKREWDVVAVRSYARGTNFQRLDRAAALAYGMNQRMNLFVLVGLHSAEKFQANVEASEVRLTPQEMDWLDLRSDSR